MEKQIVKLSPEVKTNLCKQAELEWKDIAVVLFEDDGILLYLKEYGKQKKISYKQIFNDND